MTTYTHADVREFLRTISSTSDEFIWVRLLHVDIDVQVDSDDIADAGGISDYFTQEIEEFGDNDELQDYIKEEITNHDWILVDWEGTLTSHYANQYGFDHDDYQSAVDACNANPTMTTEVIKACLECFDGDLSYLDRYRGEFNSDADYAYDELNESGAFAELPDFVSRYFDYEAYGRDLDMGGDIVSHNNHYFLSH